MKAQSLTKTGCFQLFAEEPISECAAAGTGLEAATKAPACPGSPRGKLGFAPNLCAQAPQAKPSWRAAKAKADYFIPRDCAGAALLGSWLLLYSRATKSLPGLVKLANVMKSNSVLFAQGLEKISCFHVHKQNLAQHTRELRSL